MYDKFNQKQRYIPIHFQIIIPQKSKLKNVVKHANFHLGSKAGCSGRKRSSCEAGNILYVFKIDSERNLKLWDPKYIECYPERRHYTQYYQYQEHCDEAHGSF